MFKHFTIPGLNYKNDGEDMICQFDLSKAKQFLYILHQINIESHRSLHSN